jgi:serine protease Do
MPGQAPEKAQPTGRLGIHVSDAPGGGAQVEDIENDAVRDLQPGDVITEINGTPVKDGNALRVVANRAKPGTTVLLKVRRGKVTQFVGLPIPGK